MKGLEVAAERGEVAGPRHRQLVVLADVAHVHLPLELDRADQVALGAERGDHRPGDGAKRASRSAAVAPSSGRRWVWTWS